MIIHNPILTGSFTVNGTDVASITSSAASITAINSYTASQNILNGTYATTGSNTFRAPQTINSNLTVTGSITASTLVVQTVSSSVIYSSGSNVFGNNIANTQVFTGSMNLTGSLTVTTIGTELQVTSTGVRIGNISTDTHPITGSVNVTGSISATGSIYTGGNMGTAMSSIYNASNNIIYLQNSVNGVQPANTNTVNSGSIVLTNTGGSGAYSIIASGGPATGGGIYIQSQDRTAAVYYPISLNPNGGNVGIGVTNPAFPLEVYLNSSTAYTSTSRGNVMRLYNPNSSSNVFAGIELGGAGPSNDGLAGLNAVVTSPGSAALTFYTRDSNTFAEKMRITSGGNIGIGTATPTDYSGYTTLQINGKSGAASGVVRITAADGSSGFNIYSVAGAQFNTTSAVPFIFLTQDTERMRITSGGAIQVGNVGRNALQQSNFGYNGAYKTLIVGSTGTNYLSDAITVCFGVDVVGNAGGSFSGDGSECIFRNAGAFRSPNSGNTNYNTLISWNSSGVVTVTTSDYRAKEDLKSFEALPMIEAMKLYDFRWIELQERMHGVLAHELQEIVPYAVIGEKDGDSRQGVDYSKLVPVMLKAIQELNTKFEEYKATHP